MNINESRAGDKTIGPLQLKSIWDDHKLRDFDLRIIIQVSGCETIAENVMAGKNISLKDQAVLEIANDLAGQKGYKPLFDVSENGVFFNDKGGIVLRRCF